MTDIRNVGQEVQAEILKTVRKGHETVTEAIKTVRTMTPALSDLNLPFASKLPKPEELAGSAYSFAMKVLADQRKFAEGVLHTTGHLLPGNGGTSAKKAATPRKTEAAESAETTGTAKTTRTSGTAKKTGPADSSK
jgi:hypothetical protein